jgi:hypothetical protein
MGRLPRRATSSPPACPTSTSSSRRGSSKSARPAPCAPPTPPSPPPPPLARAPRSLEATAAAAAAAAVAAAAAQAAPPRSPWGAAVPRSPWGAAVHRSPWGVAGRQTSAEAFPSSAETTYPSLGAGIPFSAGTPPCCASWFCSLPQPPRRTAGRGVDTAALQAGGGGALQPGAHGGTQEHTLACGVCFFWLRRCDCWRRRQLTTINRALLLHCCCC